MPGAGKTVLLADDHPLVLAAIAQLVESGLGLKVVATCTDGQCALEEVRRLQPDLAIVDVAMPKLTGLELLLRIKREGIRTKVVLITAAMNDAELLAAADGGAAGLMFKDRAPENLLAGLWAVLRGEKVLPQNSVAEARAREDQRRRGSSSSMLRLTPREQEVANHVAAGLSNKEIAHKLALSEGTVKVHLHRIYEKLGINKRMELVAIALRTTSSMEAVQRIDLRSQPLDPL